MEAKIVKEGCVEMTYQPGKKRFEKAVVAFRPDVSLTLTEDEFCRTLMTLKLLFTTEYSERATVPPHLRAFMEGHYQFLENAKKDPERAKFTLEIGKKPHSFSVAELKPVYENMNTVMWRIAHDFGAEVQ